MDYIANSYCEPDGWKNNGGCNGGRLEKDLDTFTDNSWPGCDYRLKSGKWIDIGYAVNVTITGRKSHFVSNMGPNFSFKTRVKIEHVGDGEKSTFQGGYIYTSIPLLLNKQPEFS